VGGGPVNTRKEEPDARTRKERKFAKGHDAVHHKNRAFGPPEDKSPIPK